jgi:hypothetical protein
MSTRPRPRCQFSELYVDECAHCRGIADAGARSPAAAAAPTRAVYAGRCAACNEPFGEGDPIKNVRGLGWIAGCCEDCDGA